jgi:DNA-binding transcriptional ArsR family regulator
MLLCRKRVIDGESMLNLLKKLQQYFREVLNTHVTVHPWTRTGELPFFLTDLYEFYEFSLFDTPCLLMISKNSSILTPMNICKHLEQIQKIWNGFTIYVQSTISFYNRKRLIQRRVPFIVPGNQMYLPQFGIDLREHFRKLLSKQEKFLSPATHAAVIYALVRETSEDLTPSTLAKQLGYTPMTMTRAFDELEGAEIGEIYRVGKERHWRFANKKALWEKAKIFLKSPVKKRVYVKQGHPKILAGISALSKFSMISPPTFSVFAIGSEGYEQWKSQGIEELPTSEDANFELEIWHYDPELFGKNGVADPFSLYLSFRTNTDERVATALDEMMENIAW